MGHNRFSPLQAASTRAIFVLILQSRRAGKFPTAHFVLMPTVFLLGSTVVVDVVFCP